MLLKVDGKTYGWGKEVRDLPENKDAYGPHILTADEEVALAKALKVAKWTPSWRQQPTERVVFLCEPGAWRQTLASKGAPGQQMQVVEGVAPEPVVPVPVRKGKGA